MKCIRCGKLILHPGRASVIRRPCEMADGTRYVEVAAWGPRCAVIAGLVKTKPRKQRAITTAPVSRRMKHAVEVGQIDWIMEIAA